MVLLHKKHRVIQNKTKKTSFINNFKYQSRKGSTIKKQPNTFQKIIKSFIIKYICCCCNPRYAKTLDDSVEKVDEPHWVYGGSVNGPNNQDSKFATVRGFLNKFKRHF